MRGDVFGDASFSGVLLDDTFDRARGESTVVTSGVGGLEVARVVEK